MAGRHLLVGVWVGGEEPPLLGQGDQEALEFGAHLRARRRHLRLPQELSGAAELPEAHATDHLPRESRALKASQRRRPGAAGHSRGRLLPRLLQQGRPLSPSGAGDPVQHQLLLRAAPTASSCPRGCRGAEQQPVVEEEECPSALGLRAAGEL